MEGLVGVLAGWLVGRQADTAAAAAATAAGMLEGAGRVVQGRGGG